MRDFDGWNRYGMSVESGMEGEHLPAWLFEFFHHLFGRGRGHHQAMPPKRAFEHRHQGLVSFEGEGIDLIHHQEVEVLLITEKLMGGENDAVAFEHPRMPTVNRDDRVFGEGGFQTGIKLYDDIPSRQSEADVHPPLHGELDDWIADLRLAGTADSVDQGIDASFEVLYRLLG